MNQPIMYSNQMFMDYFNLQPYAVKGRLNAQTEVERRYLYTKLYSVYKFTLPNEIPMNFFRYLLFHWGSGAVIYTKEFGWTFQPYGISKIDLYYQPKEVTVYNSFFRTEKRGIIGINSCILHVMDDYFGLDDIVQKYAEKLANIDKSIDINLMNSNVSVVIEGQNKKEADELKEAYAQATTGKPFVALNKSLLEGKSLHPLIAGIRSNYIVSDLLAARKNLVNQYLTEIGIANSDYEKRAQMSQDEINRNNDEVQSIVKVIYDTLKKDFETARNLTGLNWNVELRYTYEGGDMNAQTDSVGNQPVSA